MAKNLDDRTERGIWMQMNSGRQFFPLDPRPGDFDANDLANGMALDCRYAGQGRVDRYYSVAEHCFHVAAYARRWQPDPEAAFVGLLHDAPEAMINDLTRATKKVVGEAYTRLEDSIASVIWKKYDLEKAVAKYFAAVKVCDRRIVPLEIEAIEPFPGAWPYRWAFDGFKGTALEGIVIRCWEPPTAKRKWLAMHDELCSLTGRDHLKDGVVLRHSTP